MITPDTIDPTYLRTEQYRTGQNLQRRISLHNRFGTSRPDWHRWVFNHLKFTPKARILEVGCGTGALWAKNVDRVPAEWYVVLSDLSPGMVATARQACGPSWHPSNMLVADVRAIPFPDFTFDAVIANHMLYHVAERNQALKEIRRVLRPEGELFAATNGSAHLSELDEIAEECGIQRVRVSNPTLFGLDNGVEQLEKAQFTFVDVFHRLDELRIDDLEAVLDFVASVTPVKDVPTRWRAFSMLEGLVAEQIAKNGAFRVTTDAGLLYARMT